MIQRWFLLSFFFHICSLIRYDAVKQQTGYFWHIDSANLNLGYNITGDRTKNCHKMDSDRLRGSQTGLYYTLGEFGDASCDAPMSLVRSAAHFIKKVRGDDFDFILWTGDSRPHSSNVMRENSTIYLEEMTSLLKEEFRYSTVYPVLGDMDYSPTGQARPKESGYYKIDMAGRKLELVGINTALYLETNMVTRASYHHGDHDPGNQWRWLQATLEKAREQHKTVIIFGHTPPGIFEHDWDSPGTHWLQHSHNVRYHRMIEQYSDVVVGQFFGHQNTDTFRVFYNSKRQPVSWALVSPGISPIARPDGSRQPILHRPSIRLYKYSIYDGKVLDYSQFSLDLSKSNAESKPVWELHYNFSSYFNTDVITPESMDSLYNRMAQGANAYNEAVKEGGDAGDSLITRYLRANNGQRDQSVFCPHSCIKVHLCAVPNVDITNFMKCLTQANSCPKMSQQIIITLIIVISILTSVS